VKERDREREREKERESERDRKKESERKREREGESERARVRVDVYIHIHQCVSTYTHQCVYTYSLRRVVESLYIYAIVYDLLVSSSSQMDKRASMHTNISRKRDSPPSVVETLHRVAKTHRMPSVAGHFPQKSH